MAEARLAIIGAGAAGCALAASLRQRGWAGPIHLREIGRGPGGRAATRRSRRDAGLRIDHGAPLFNISAASAEPTLLEPLRLGGWIRPWSGAIRSLDVDGRLGDPFADGFSDGALWQGHGGMDQLSKGLLALAQAHPGDTRCHYGCLVRNLEPRPAATGQGWSLRDAGGSELQQADWLVLSGSLLAHPRCRAVFGWAEVPLQAAAARCNDPQLTAAAAALTALESSASSNLMRVLAADEAAAWLAQPWRLLQLQPAAQERHGLRRLTLQPLADGRCALVAESSPAFAAANRQVFGSRSSAAQLLGAAPEADQERRVLDGLEAAVGEALGPLQGLRLSSAGAEDRQLMRWGAAFPRGDDPETGLPAALSLCPASRIGFCGDLAAGAGFGRVEGALRSAEALAERLLAEL
jgi:predicted NAD/FAD-dependent oxidoreductase